MISRSANSRAVSLDQALLVGEVEVHPPSRLSGARELGLDVLGEQVGDALRDRARGS